MNNQEFIDLCSDEEIEVADVKPLLLSSIAQNNTSHGTADDPQKFGKHLVSHELEETKLPHIVNGVSPSFCLPDRASLYADGFSRASSLSSSSMPVCRQFWKSGDYEVGRALVPISNGPTRLRIHPKFLHSNATSHKWAFGAIAELLDNSIDEVENGSTFVIVDKFINPRNGDPALLIQDDGSGMDPESLRRCMSFGFSDKQSDASIGQYGNGFKTSTMRLGADVIVFSCCMNKRVLTRSVGLLSYTFLRQTGSDDVVVPLVDFEFNPLTGTFERLIRHDDKQFLSNLSTLLRWSPFSTELELLNQFNDIGQHGTKIVVFNLWFNDDGGMELDFESDPEDIVINGAQRKVQKNSAEHSLSRNYIANRLHYSLRAYSSVLYLRMPENFKIILRGQVVKHHHIVKDLMYLECIQYRPQVGGMIEGEILTTIGFLEGAPNVNVQGFNVYHRNRLILPFWRVAHNSYGKGRGVVGVLEANFIKPTHDKQDFEKSTLFQKLETRLKEMTYEYWDFHCHLVGYTKSKNPSAMIPAAAPANRTPNLGTSNRNQQNKMTHGATTTAGNSQSPVGTPSCLPGASWPVTSSNPTCLTPGQTTNGNGNVNYQTGSRQNGKYERTRTAAMESLKKRMVSAGNADGFGRPQKTLSECSMGRKRKQEVMIMMQENKKLLDQCLEYEETEKKLLLKAAKLKSELSEVQHVYKNLLVELKMMDDVKMETL